MWFLVFLGGCASDDLDSDAHTDVSDSDTSTPVADACPWLAFPSGKTVEVASVQELVDALAAATVGETILVADGVYDLSGTALWINTEGVTVRGAGGNRDAVVLDGHFTDDGQLVAIGASNVTLAHLTVQNTNYHPIHVWPYQGASLEDVLLYDLRVVDPGQQAIKVNTDNGGDPQYFVDDLEIACSSLELTPVGRENVLNINGGQCYTGGIDAHATRNLHVHHNVITGFWCGDAVSYPSEHGIHAWNGARDTVVENNLLVDDARGIGLGLGDGSWGVSRTYEDVSCAGGPFGHVGGVVRNNMVVVTDPELFAAPYGFDVGIGIEQTCDASVLHNTVYSSEPPGSSSIEYRFSSTVAWISSNFTSGAILQRDGAQATLEANLSQATAGDFVDAVGRDLHLVTTSLAVDAGIDLEGACNEDFDDETRGESPDVGADEIPH